MENRKTYKIFRYENDIRWTDDRKGALSGAFKPELPISSPPEFKGDRGFWSPEDMLVGAVNACVLMTFVAYAQHKGLELVSYTSSAEGVLESIDGQYRFTEVVLLPHVVVKSEEDMALAREIMRDACRCSMITNSTTAAVKVFPQFHLHATVETGTVHV